MVLLAAGEVGDQSIVGEIADLHTQMDAGVSDAGIFKFFAAKYGPTVLASPVRGGFDNAAWIVPFAVFILGILGIVLLLRLWQRRDARLAAALPSAPPTPDADALRDRIRNETKYGE